MEAYAQTAEGRARVFIEHHQNALGLLAAMAKADGAVRAKERGLVALWCIQHGASPATAAAVAKDVRAWFKPSAAAIGKDLRSIKTMPKNYQESILQTMEAMITSDKQAKDDETRLIKRARKELALGKPATHKQN